MLRRHDDPGELMAVELEHDGGAPALQDQEIFATVELPLAHRQRERDGGTRSANSTHPDPGVVGDDRRPNLRPLHREVLSTQRQCLLGSRQSDLETVRVKVKGRHASSLPVICREWDGDSSQRHNGHVDGQAQHRHRAYDKDAPSATRARRADRAAPGSTRLSGYAGCAAAAAFAAAGRASMMRSRATSS